MNTLENLYHRALSDYPNRLDMSVSLLENRMNKLQLLNSSRGILLSTIVRALALIFGPVMFLGGALVTSLGILEILDGANVFNVPNNPYRSQPEVQMGLGLFEAFYGAAAAWIGAFVTSLGMDED